MINLLEGGVGVEGLLLEHVGALEGAPRPATHALQQRHRHHHRPGPQPQHLHLIAPPRHSVRHIAGDGILKAEERIVIQEVIFHCVACVRHATAPPLPLDIPQIHIEHKLDLHLLILALVGPVRDTRAI